MSPAADAAVVGGGPAGCSAAIFLAQRGVNVILVEKARFPRAKACGEGVMPSGLGALRRLGVLAEVERAGRRFSGVRFTEPGGRSAAGEFSGGGYGLVLSRETLDLILLEKAKTVPGITVLEGRRAVRPLLDARGFLEGFETAASYPDGAPGPLEIRARQTVIADGSLSLAAEALGLKRRLPRRRRYGLRTHFAGIAGLGDKVEVFFIPGGEIYVAPHREPGTALVSLLLEESALGRFAGRTVAAFEETLLSCAFLLDRFSGASRLSPVIGLGPLGGRRDSWSGPGWLLAGDAASSVDPITGDGIAIALQNGELAAETIFRRLQGRSPEGDGAAYESARRALLRDKQMRERLLLTLTSAGPLVRRGVLTVMAASPKLFSLLMSEGFSRTDPPEIG